ncbi:dCTP deaminase/dUTPase family protein [Blattabacterium cuenoti]|uniref:dUTP diphosphatase n=1 Tax=Blattabacterium cuenoti TaxID=1653831 RepID=UPI00163CB6B5|nr:dUTP diphosphatase [Blattabacterium cuenoti]
MRKEIIHQLVLTANIKKTTSINFLERKLISTGVFIQILKNIRYSFFLRKNLKKYICIIHLNKEHLNYKYKEIQIIIINVCFKNIKIEPYEKLLIIDLVKNVKIKWEQCSILNRSTRGSSCFGSTGI